MYTWHRTGAITSSELTCASRNRYTCYSRQHELRRDIRPKGQKQGSYPIVVLVILKLSHIPTETRFVLSHQHLQRRESFLGSFTWLFLMTRFSIGCLRKGQLITTVKLWGANLHTVVRGETNFFIARERHLSNELDIAIQLWSTRSVILVVILIQRHIDIVDDWVAKPEFLLRTKSRSRTLTSLRFCVLICCRVSKMRISCRSYLYTTELPFKVRELESVLWHVEVMWN